MKKALRRAFALLLCLALCVMPVTAGTDTGDRDLSFYTASAAYLKELGLFRGVSDTDYDLNRAPTRVEAVVMLIRLLGEERAALAAGCSHPFADVPQWADAYIGWAWQKGYTRGVSETEFGTGEASAQMYLTFVLRALGYSDTDGRDFTYADPYTPAMHLGLLNDAVNAEQFLRADAAFVSYLALSCTVRGTEQTLMDRLYASGAFTYDEYEAALAVSAASADLVADPGSNAAGYGKAYAALGTCIADHAQYYSEESGIYTLKYDASGLGAGEAFLVQYAPKSGWLCFTLGRIDGADYRAARLFVYSGRCRMSRAVIMANRYSDAQRTALTDSLNCTFELYSPSLSNSTDLRIGNAVSAAATGTLYAAAETQSTVTADTLALLLRCAHAAEAFARSTGCGYGMADLGFRL